MIAAGDTVAQLRRHRVEGLRKGLPRPLVLEKVRRRVEVDALEKIASEASHVANLDEKIARQLALDGEINRVIARIADLRINREREQFAKCRGDANPLGRRDRRADREVCRHGYRPVYSGAQRLGAERRDVDSGCHAERLREADSEHRQHDALHGIQPVVNQRVAAAHDRLSAAKHPTQQSTLEAGLPGRRKARRETPAVDVKPAIATSVFERRVGDIRIENIARFRRRLLLAQVVQRVYQLPGVFVDQHRLAAQRIHRRRVPTVLQPVSERERRLHPPDIGCVEFPVTQDHVVDESRADRQRLQVNVAHRHIRHIIDQPEQRRVKLVVARHVSSLQAVLGHDGATGGQALSRGDRHAAGRANIGHGRAQRADLVVAVMEGGDVTQAAAELHGVLSLRPGGVVGELGRAGATVGCSVSSEVT